MAQAETDFVCKELKGVLYSYNFVVFLFITSCTDAVGWKQRPRERQYRTERETSDKMRPFLYDG